MRFKQCFRPCFSIVLMVLLQQSNAGDDDYNLVHRDGSYQFGYDTPDSYHRADANRNNVVRGEFGARNPGTGRFDNTVYTAGPRGYRPRGNNIARKYDLNQAGPRPVGSPDDPYFDPLEDPSYSFAFKTRTYTRQENANRLGDVTGKYSYIDDVGERHNVEFIAGKNTGFHVKTPYPDSNPRAYGPLYFRGRGKPIPRGRTSIQRGLDGSYRFVSAGPDQRRTEVSDSSGHVRGSYTYLDDKGVQHSVHYIAGPETGYRVLKNVKGPHLPTLYPFGGPGIIPPDFYDYIGKEGDLFDTAASGSVRPTSGGAAGKPPKNNMPFFDNGIDVSKEDFDKFNDDTGKPGISNPGVGFPSTTEKPAGSRRPFGSGAGGGSGIPGSSSIGGGFSGPTYEGTGSGSIEDDLFGDFSGSAAPKPGKKPSADGGTYKPQGNDGSYKPVSTGSGYSSGGEGRPTGMTPRPFSTSKPQRYPDDSGEGYTTESNTFQGGFGSRPGTRPGSQDSGFATRPNLRPNGFGERPGAPNIRPNVRPGVRPGARPGSRPGATPGARPGGRPVGRPGGGFGGDDYDNSDELSSGLFGSETSAQPPKPTIQIGISQNARPGEAGKECSRCTHTLVRNLGDTLFSVPPGGAVRAHVQAIDLLPVVSKVPSPSEQYRAEMDVKTEQLNAASSDVVGSNSTPSTESIPTTTEVDTTTNSTPFLSSNETSTTPSNA